METRKVGDLKPHPLNAQVYGDCDGELSESVRVHGVRPVLVTCEASDLGANVIIAGHRRVAAAKKIGLACVPVEVSPLTDALDIEEALIADNNQRMKDGEVIGREANKLLEIAKERAKRRMVRKPDDSARKPVSEQTGRARDEVGRKLGVSGLTAERAGAVVTVIDQLTDEGQTQQAEELRQTLKKSTARAYQDARPIIEQQKPKAQPAVSAKPTFNATNDNIEWAKWSWNPVTGCKHGCPYCYARDIAMRFTGHFRPEFHADRLEAPQYTRIPAGREQEPGIHNVFVGSMCDLFGEWVPDEWINRVLDQVRKAPDWNFLFLTKNPERYLLVEFPDNCWVGATTDTQERLERAFSVFMQLREGNRKPSVTFISAEPLSEEISICNWIERRVFHSDGPDLDMVQSCLDWVIIGGRSESSKMPAAQPEWRWVETLLDEARHMNRKVYFKPNLTVVPKEYPK